VDGASEAGGGAGDQTYVEGARRFAERYRKFDPAAQREGMLGRAVEMLDRTDADIAPALAASA
jgi:hypothetical protein